VIFYSKDVAGYSLAETATCYILPLLREHRAACALRRSAAPRLDAVGGHANMIIAPFAVRLSTMPILKCDGVFCKNCLRFVQVRSENTDGRQDRKVARVDE
jgi:hypothetical protein